MEIERKFLLKEIPFDLKLKDIYYVSQNYLSLNPEIRIRLRVNLKTMKAEYILTGKSEGNLSRIEKEEKLTLEEYNMCLKNVYGEAINKITCNFELDKDHILECSIVDADKPTSFIYGEIEFKSEKDANDYKVPDFLNDEITNANDYKMKNYFIKTRQK